MSRKYIIFLLIVGVAVVSDYVTKSIAEQSLATQTTSWEHSIVRDVRESESGLTAEQWAIQRLGVDLEDEQESRTLHAMYLTQSDDPRVSPRRLRPSTVVRGGDEIEIRWRVVEVVDGFWRYTYARNPGAAFGFLAGASKSFSRPFFMVVSVVALLVIFSLLRGVREENVALVVALAMITGGAIGNLIDRVLYGYVIDFIEWYVVAGGEEKIWPTFNVADSFISVGVTLMLILMFTGRVEFEEDENESEVSA